MTLINSTKRLFSIIAFFFIAFTPKHINAQCGTPISPTITTTPPTCSNCCDGTATVTASGGCPPYQYTFQSPSGSGPSIPEMNGLCNGNYTVTVIDNCCPSVSYTFQALYVAPTSINELNTRNTLLNVENPSSEFINIRSNSIENNGYYEINIYDSFGQVVYFDKKFISDIPAQIKHNLNSGLFFLVYKNANMTTSFKKKIIIEK